MHCVLSDWVENSSAAYADVIQTPNNRNVSFTITDVSLRKHINFTNKTLKGFLATLPFICFSATQTASAVRGAELDNAGMHVTCVSHTGQAHISF